MNKILIGLIGGIVIFIGALAFYNINADIQGDSGSIAERTLTISPGKIVEKDNFGNLTINPEANFTATLNVTDFETAVTAEGIDFGAALAFSRGQVDHKKEELVDNLIGIVNDDFLETYNFTLEEGEFYTDDVDENVIVVGQTIKQQLTDKGADAIGQTLLVRGTKFKIIGVLDTISTGIASADTDWNKLLVLPYSRSDPIIEEEPMVEEMRLVVSSVGSIDTAASNVEAKLLESRGTDDFSVLTPQDISDLDALLQQ